MQHSLFAVPGSLASSGDPWSRRQYQLDAVENTYTELEKHNSTAIILGTGLGKTRTAGYGVIGRWITEKRGPVVWLTHLDTLVRQSRAALSKMLGVPVGVEQGPMRWADEPVCIASVATLYREERLKWIARRKPTLVIADELHHFVADANLKIVNTLKETAKFVGLTATPRRADGIGMHNVVESVAIEYNMSDGIRDGYLVPVEIAPARIPSLDYSHLKDREFTDENLASAQEKALKGIMVETLRFTEGRHVIMFWPTVRASELGADLFNHPDGGKPGCATHVDGSRQDKWTKNARLEAFERREYQYLMNVGVAIEGYDCPIVDTVGMVTPDKSISRYIQKMGRLTRPACDVDSFEAAEERRAAIARSAKPCGVVIDYVGNAGRHASQIKMAIDALAGKDVDEKTMKRAREVSEGKRMTVDEAIEKARAELAEEKRRELEAAAKAEAARIEWGKQHPFDDPLDPDESPYEIHGLTQVEPQQTQYLKSIGFTSADLGRLRDRSHAARIISRLKARRRAGLASFKAARALKRAGVPGYEQFSQTAARRLLAYMAAERKRTGAFRNVAPPRETIVEICGREPGSDDD